jgi:HK97 family phage portal protein
MNLRDQMNAWAARRMANWLAVRARQETGNGADIIKIITEAWGGGKSASGVSINEDKALTIGAVYTALRIIGGTMASLPLHVMRRTERGGEFAVRHWAYPLLHDSPNEYHSSFTWREVLIAHLLLWGNHYSRIEWLKNGSAGALYPLMPWCVQPYRTPNGEQRYRVLMADGKEDLPSDEMLHIPGLGYDGIKGLSVIQYQKDALGTSKAMELFTAGFFRNGAKPGAILETPGRMKPDAQKNLAESIAEKFGDASDAFKVLVLEEGSKLHTYTMPLQDAQLLDSRKLSRSEVFGLYGVPPHLGGDTERSTSWGTGIEQQDIGYAKHTITPLCVRIEQELNRKLFGRGSGLYAKFNLAGLMRGDFKSRMEGMRIAVGGPFLTRAEAREIEDWNMSSEAGMDQVLTPLNMGVGANPPRTEKIPADDPQDPKQE